MTVCSSHDALTYIAVVNGSMGGFVHYLLHRESIVTENSLKVCRHHDLSDKPN